MWVGLWFHAIPGGAKYIADMAFTTDTDACMLATTDVTTNAIGYLAHMHYNDHSAKLYNA